MDPSFGCTLQPASLPLSHVKDPLHIRRGGRQASLQYRERWLSDNSAKRKTGSGASLSPYPCTMPASAFPGGAGRCQVPGAVCGARGTQGARGVKRDPLAPGRHVIARCR
ncbi:hypothetical protein AAFF_G00356870 [Aldrovandia affinis]|uniref:Uncharacterized protein n=1 Tax=Aldrovandia affinis TaxID=143900 RepID=A0AAD7X1W6_9TELE|nr:hypothetical protein AAFF_G00356870 [Aldrovandia affinis]